MDNKIQALTDKLYQDGLSKGKEEGERLLAKAKEDAARMREEAEKQASDIVEKARKEAEDMKNNALTEIKITSRQMLSALRQEVENALMKKVVEPGVRSAMEQQSFMQELMLKAIESFRPDKHNGMELRLLLPESERERYNAFLKDLVGGTLKDSVEVAFESDLQCGFRILNKQGGYMLDFTDEAFSALFKEYARPRIKQLLF
ncbi:MAG: hypothetical protein K2O66_04345 [Bacteroidales bacterium]|nr:hypothetical protein [Bacteroidales bacterium]MDE7072576.1 hypothetical protein [Bacteroidales bacterium]